MPRNSITHHCLSCGKPFLTYPYAIKRGGGKYCSHACHNVAQRHELAPRFWSKVDKAGDRNGNRLHPERVARGERAGKAKLTTDDVRAIRQRFAAGGVTKRALAAEYGIHETTLLGIIRRDYWAHVA